MTSKEAVKLLGAVDRLNNALYLVEAIRLTAGALPDGQANPVAELACTAARRLEKVRDRLDRLRMRPETQGAEA
jgi:hypothetical protein